MTKAEEGKVALVIAKLDGKLIRCDQHVSSFAIPRYDPEGDKSTCCDQLVNRVFAFKSFSYFPYYVQSCDFHLRRYTMDFKNLWEEIK